MINNINTPWQNINIQTPNRPQTASFHIPADTSATINSEDVPVFATLKLLLPGGGTMSASVFRAEGFSADNPVMLVKGINVDGTSFEAVVNIRNVNPGNASFVEMLALDGYFAANGKPSVVRTLAGLGVFKNASGSADAFTQFNFAGALKESLAAQHSQGHWETYLWIRSVLDNLLNHIAQRQ